MARFIAGSSSVIIAVIPIYNSLLVLEQCNPHRFPHF